MTTHPAKTAWTPTCHPCRNNPHKRLDLPHTAYHIFTLLSTFEKSYYRHAQQREMKYCSKINSNPSAFAYNQFSRQIGRIVCLNKTKAIESVFYQGKIRIVETLFQNRKFQAKLQHCFKQITLVSQCKQNIFSQGFQAIMLKSQKK